LARRLKSGVLEAFCKFTEDTEVPAVFAVWAGIATISAALGRDCFVDQGYFTVYPNLYIVLVSGSARCRKSTAIGIAEDFIKQIKPAVNILSQKMTPEGLIGALSGMIGEIGATEVVPAAIGIAIVDELSTLIDKNAFKSGMISILTKLYDAKDFEYLTRGRGREMVKNPCLSILGGSTLHWIKESVPIVSIGGGFTSRVVFIYKDKREKLVPWPVLSAENKQRKEDIIHDLNEVAKLRGPFAVDNQALEMYKSEYVNFYENSHLMDNQDLSGYANRRHHILLKLSMIISASRRDSRVITASDMSTSVSIMQRAEESMPLILRALTAKEIGDTFDEILKFLIRHKVANKSDLIRHFRHKLSSQQIDEVMRTLEEGGYIAVEVDGRAIRYVLTSTYR